MTILDEDFPGTLGFDLTDIKANKSQERVDIVIKRSEGSDGRISCTVKTEPLVDRGNSDANAIENVDYIPIKEKIEFENGEMDRIISIELKNKKGESQDDDQEEDEGTDEADREKADLMFKVKLEKA